MEHGFGGLNGLARIIIQGFTKNKNSVKRCLSCVNAILRIYLIIL